MLSASEFALVLQQARAGSEAALATLLEAHRPQLNRLARGRVGRRLSPKAGESDLAQETFIRAWRSFLAFRGDTAAELAGWLQQIHRHTICDLLDWYRRGRRDVGREASLDGPDALDLPGVAPTPSSALARVEDRQARKMRLRAALLKLPAAERTVVQWRLRDGRSFASIGEELFPTEADADRAAARARKRFERAKSRLRDLMEAANDERRVGLD